MCQDSSCAAAVTSIKKHCDRPCLSLDDDVLAGFSVLSKACVLRNTLHTDKSRVATDQKSGQTVSSQTTWPVCAILARIVRHMHRSITVTAKLELKSASDQEIWQESCHNAFASQQTYCSKQVPHNQSSKSNACNLQIMRPDFRTLLPGPVTRKPCSHHSKTSAGTSS